MPLTHLAAATAVGTLWLTALAWWWKAVTVSLGVGKVPNLPDQRYAVAAPAGASLVVIVPACNEAESIERCIRSLLAQDLPGLQVVAVNDRSTDDTPAILDRVAREAGDMLTVLTVRVLPPDWLGKTHAMALAAREAIALHRPRWLLFTDGDIFFAPGALRRSLAAAEQLEADHFVTVPTPILKHWSEGMMMGFLQVLGLWTTRLWRVSDPRARDCFGIGAFNLIRTAVYTELGGFESLRMEILEDLTLARRIKQQGFRQRVAFGPGLVQVHWALGAGGVVRTMTKNLFAIFRFRTLPVLFACLCLAVICIGPCVGLVWSATRIAAVPSLAAVALLYVITGRFSRIPVTAVLGFPVAAALFIYSLLRSAAVTLRNDGVEWRGTLYPLAELRARSSGPL